MLLDSNVCTVLGPPQIQILIKRPNRSLESFFNSINNLTILFTSVCGHLPYAVKKLTKVSKRFAGSLV